MSSAVYFSPRSAASQSRRRSSSKRDEVAHGDADSADAEIVIPLLPRSFKNPPVQREAPTIDLSSKSWDRIRQRHDLLFEAQRRSTDYHLDEYLTLRRDVWLNLITGAAISDDGSLKGNLDALKPDVWRLIVTKDQLESDLIMMGEYLRIFLEKATGKIGWSISCFASIGFFTALEKIYSNRERPWYLRYFLWALFGASGLETAYNGLRLALIYWLKRRTSTTQKKLEYDELLEKDRTNFDDRIWNTLQFSNTL
ncbi:hypothetical protein AOQ84DRAFT_441206 [Glonium stellatum]|uniref:Uncharacterized protein n=1 Tax=Glonium stellatum TaxID=574774 RepID=A0A8E2EWA0_9PEZI|nr:hypothetical protein AOQ84DRAFT_441206 [Glonium stellatum]